MSQSSPSSGVDRLTQAEIDSLRRELQQDTATLQKRIAERKAPANADQADLRQNAPTENFDEQSGITKESPASLP